MLPALKRPSFIRFGAGLPDEHRSNFWHLYLDIGWFGLLSASSVAFLVVYATRQGASSFQIGLLNGAPALVALLFALPAGQWLRGKPIREVVFWSSVAHRLPYLFWVILPFAFTPAIQVQLLIALVFVMSIPGTVLAISFNGLYAMAVPVPWRGHVTGVRNSFYALVAILVSLLCGWILATYPMQSGYQVVFALGFLGAALSSLHLWFIRPPVETPALKSKTRITRDWGSPGLLKTWVGQQRSVGLRYLMANHARENILLRVVGNARFRMVLLLLFLFHASLYLANPIFPLFLIRELGLSDQAYSLGNGLFYLSIFLGSTQLARLTNRWGNWKSLSVGAMMTGMYPVLISLSSTAPHYLVASVWGGLAWSVAGGALGNYMLDRIPDDDHAPYLAWYNLATQAAILLGSLAGPLVGEWIGLVPAMLLAAGGRLLSGILIRVWG